MLQGQAGVWAVSSQLAMRGIAPIFPGVDLGYDLALENGLRLQVRTATLTTTGSNKKYPYCAYVFHVRRDCWYAGVGRRRGQYAVTTPFSKVADYFVFWGIDENRFFIVPTTVELKASIYFPKKNFAGNWIQRTQRSTKRLDEKLAAYEDRWDLLDVDAVSTKLLDSVCAEKVKEN